MENKMDKIHEEYRRLCLILGDIAVKIKGLENSKAMLFKQLEELDGQAAIVKEQEDAKREEDSKAQEDSVSAVSAN